jgi:hypothetical protein
MKSEPALRRPVLQHSKPCSESCCPLTCLTTTASSCWIGSVLCSSVVPSQTAVVPPSTTNSIPLTKLESSEARNNATVAIS